jgi:hypothetical protein
MIRFSGPRSGRWRVALVACQSVSWVGMRVLTDKQLVPLARGPDTRHSLVGCVTRTHLSEGVRFARRPDQNSGCGELSRRNHAVYPASPSPSVSPRR